jgi:hypothetical protein
MSFESLLDDKLPLFGLDDAPIRRVLRTFMDEIEALKRKADISEQRNHELEGIHSTMGSLSHKCSSFNSNSDSDFYFDSGWWSHRGDQRFPRKCVFFSIIHIKDPCIMYDPLIPSSPHQPTHCSLQSRHLGFSTRGNISFLFVGVHSKCKITWNEWMCNK